jgi:uncharacterized protein (TIGR03545 family)
LSFDRLSVADQEQPMRNLFELGGSEADLDTNQLLKAKVVISNLEIREVRWHTPRQSSGALPEDRQAEEEAEREQAPGTDGLKLILGSLDAGSLVDDQLARLSSPAGIAGMNSRLQTLQAQWQGKVEQGRRDVDELAGRIETVRSIDVGSLDTVPELQQAVTDIQQAATALDRVRGDLRGVDRQIKADGEEIASARAEFQEAVDTDVAYLYSISDLSSGELKNLVSDLAAGYLQQILGRYYGYARRARGYAQRLVTGNKESRKDREKVNRRQRGLDVRFNVVEYPRFLLKNARVTVKNGSKDVEASLQNFSSNPDLIDRPLSFSFLQSEGRKKLAVDGVLDNREQRDTDLELGVQAAGFTFQRTEGLADLGLSSLEAEYDLRTGFSRSSQMAAAEGRGLLRLYDLVVQPASGRKRMGVVLSETLGSLSSLDVAFDYTVEGEKPVRIVARSSADEQVARALEERFTEVSAQYQEQLRDELTARMASQIRENQALSQAFADLVRRSDGNLADTAAYEAALAQKRAEVEERIAAVRQQATDAVRSQLESQLEKLPLPKLKF